jgi:hypothetical protein
MFCSTCAVLALSNSEMNGSAVSLFPGGPRDYVIA